MIRFGDMCSGAGGLSQGFEDVGLIPVVAQDSWKQASDTYQQNFPHTPFTNRRIHESNEYTLYNSLGDNNIDVLAGSPTVEESKEGRKTALQSFARIAVGVLPDVIVFEGEPKVFTGFPDQVFALELIDPLVEAGYRIKMEKYNIADFGVPQERTRALMIASRRRVPHLPQKHTRRISVAEALEQPIHPDDKWGKTEALTPKNLLRAQHIGPGKSLSDLPEELQFDFWKRLGEKKRSGGLPTYLRRLDPDLPSKAVSYRAYDQIIHPT